MRTHVKPEQCLEQMSFLPETAGRETLIEEQNIDFRDTVTRSRGDCAVIALALALNKPYCCTRDLLKARWRKHNPEEKVLPPKIEGNLAHRTLTTIKGQVIRWATNERKLTEHDPIWGTPSIVYGNTLEVEGSIWGQRAFKMIYEKDKGHPPICICKPEKHL